jgi:hypothetical protein
VLLVAWRGGGVFGGVAGVNSREDWWPVEPA